jgi:hypothetical protein
LPNAFADQRVEARGSAREQNLDGAVVVPSTTRGNCMEAEENERALVARGQGKRTPMRDERV